MDGFAFFFLLCVFVLVRGNEGWSRVRCGNSSGFEFWVSSDVDVDGKVHQMASRSTRYLVSRQLLFGTRESKVV